MALRTLRYLLYPFALLYGLVIRIRNFLYDKRVLRSVSFDLPVIVAGNLTTGGTGKTPFVEYLIRLLSAETRVAVLSRGYRRNTKGFRYVSTSSASEEVGDEPLQIALKFPQSTIAVDRKRVRGIRNLVGTATPPECIILDDGFQHRSLQPGLAVLLTEYTDLFCHDHLLPVGNLREHAFNSKRADIIVVTKAPAVHSPISEKLIRKVLKPDQRQWLFFSYIRYGTPLPADTQNTPPRDGKHFNTIVLFTGIANPAPLQVHVAQMCSEVVPLTFSDHHNYSGKDIRRILRVYDDLFTRNKILITTEKDIARMHKKETCRLFEGYPLYYIPVTFGFHPHIKGFTFDQIILQYVRENKKGYRPDTVGHPSSA